MRLEVLQIPTNTYTHTYLMQHISVYAVIYMCMCGCVRALLKALTACCATSLTSKTIRTRTVVIGDAIYASAAVLAGPRPAFIPICLALNSRVTVDAVA